MSYADRDAVIAWLDAGNGEGLYTTARLLLVELAEYRREDTGLAWRPREHFARRWGLAEATVRDATRRLVRTGYLVVVEKGTWHRSSRYRFTDSFLDSIAEFRKAIGGGETPPVEGDRGWPTNTQGVADQHTGGGETPPNQSSRRSHQGVAEEDSTEDSDADASLSGLRIGPEDTETIIEDVENRLQLSRDKAVSFIEGKMAKRKSGDPVGNPVAYFERVVSNELASRTMEERPKKGTTRRGTRQRSEAPRIPCPYPDCEGSYTKQGMGNHVKTHKTTCPRCLRSGVSWSDVERMGHCWPCRRQMRQDDGAEPARCSVCGIALVHLQYRSDGSRRCRDHAFTKLEEVTS